MVFHVNPLMFPFWLIRFGEQPQNFRRSQRRPAKSALFLLVKINAQGLLIKSDGYELHLLFGVSKQMQHNLVVKTLSATH